MKKTGGLPAGRIEAAGSAASAGPVTAMLARPVRAHHAGFAAAASQLHNGRHLMAIASAAPAPAGSVPPSPQHASVHVRTAKLVPSIQTQAAYSEVYAGLLGKENCDSPRRESAASESPRVRVLTPSGNSPCRQKALGGRQTTDFEAALAMQALFGS